MQLKSDKQLGSVHVANSVIAEIAGAVTTDCYGVVGMAARSVKDDIVKLIKSDITRGINVVVEDSGIVLDIHIIVQYGVNINTICKSIVNRVRYAIETNVGLKVNRINVKVEGVRQN